VGFTYLNFFFLFRCPLGGSFLNYSELDDSDQQAIFYMLIDCVSYILNFQKCNRCGAVAKVRFEIPSCRKMSSHTVGTPNFQHQRTKFVICTFPCDPTSCTWHSTIFSNPKPLISQLEKYWNIINITRPCPYIHLFVLLISHTPLLLSTIT